MLTIDRLKSLLRYDPILGVWTHLTSRGGVCVGSVAGCISVKGYRFLNIDGKTYISGRVAVFYMTGAWPPHDVDHKNLDRADDRWENLRMATTAQNMANRPLHKNNTSGFKGVHLSKQSGKWIAEIGVDGKVKHLGSFISRDAAHAAYVEAAKAVYGEFARAS